MNTGALLVSVAAHAALVAAVIAGAASSSSGPSRAPFGPGDVVWVTLPAAAAAPPRIASRAVEHPAPEPTPLPAAPAAPSEVAVASLEAQPAPPRAPLEHCADPVVEPAESPHDAVAAGADSGADALSVASAAASYRATWPGATQVDRPARPRWPIRPEYPKAARQRGDESVVVVEAWVDDDGAVAFSSILDSGGDDFDASAMRAVDGASFVPARADGRAVPSRVALRIHFALRD